MQSGWSSALRIVVVAALAGTGACTRFGYDQVMRLRETRDAGKPALDAGSRMDAMLDARASDAAIGVDNPAYVSDAGGAAEGPETPKDASVAVADPEPPTDANDAAVAAPDPEAAADAGPEPPPPPGGCGNGASLGGVCWYLAPAGTPCMTLCESHGAYTPALSYAGDAAQGGSAERCDMVLDLLIGPGATQSGYRIDGKGLGCHVFEGARWWLKQGPAFSPLASHPSAQAACSCTGP